MLAALMGVLARLSFRNSDDTDHDLDHANERRAGKGPLPWRGIRRGLT
jgi:hypothetical protein